MTLAFPNPSRSFDASRNVVRFTGYDGMFEVSFLVEIAALVSSTADRVPERIEAACLSGFDRLRASVYAAATKAYADGRRSPYVLTAADVR